MQFGRTNRFCLTSPLSTIEVVARLRASTYDRGRSSRFTPGVDRPRFEGHITENAFAIQAIGPTRGYATGLRLEATVKPIPTGSSIEGYCNWSGATIFLASSVIAILGLQFRVIWVRTPRPEAVSSLIMIGILTFSLGILIAYFLVGRHWAIRRLKELICEPK